MLLQIPGIENYKQKNVKKEITCGNTLGVNSSV